MSGGATAVTNGRELELQVVELAESLGLLAVRGVHVGKRIWGANRIIDIVLTGMDQRRLGVECKFQMQTGSAEEKIPLTLQDISAWPIPGLVVFMGEGFTDHMRRFLEASGKAVEYVDLEMWLRLFFGLPLSGDPVW